MNQKNKETILGFHTPKKNLINIHKEKKNFQKKGNFYLSFEKCIINHFCLENYLNFFWNSIKKINLILKFKKKLLVFRKKILLAQKKEYETFSQKLKNRSKTFKLNKEENFEPLNKLDEEKKKIKEITKILRIKNKTLDSNNKFPLFGYKKFYSPLLKIIKKIIDTTDFHNISLIHYLERLPKISKFFFLFKIAGNGILENSGRKLSLNQMFPKNDHSKTNKKTQNLFEEKERFSTSNTKLDLKKNLVTFGQIKDNIKLKNHQLEPSDYKTLHIMERLEHFRLELSEMIAENEKNLKDKKIGQTIKKIKKIFYECVGDSWRNLLKILDKETNLFNKETYDSSYTPIKESLPESIVDLKKNINGAFGEENTGKKRKPKNKNFSYSLTWALYNYLPILTWFPQYNWKKYLKDDFVAGVTVGVLLIAQGMAYAKLAGLSPEYGLYSSGLPLLIYPIFGTSRHLGFGPVALISLLVSQITMSTNKAGYDYSQNEKTSFALLIAFCVGLTQVFMGLIKIGFIINFISKPVIQGFTNAAAFVIILSQLQHVLGYNVNKSHYPIITFCNYITNIKKFRWQPFLFATININFILFVKYVNKKFNLELPGPIICVFLSIFITQICKLNRFGISIQNKIPKGFPSIKGPVFNEVTKVAPTVLTISFINFLETMAIATKVADKHGYKIVPDQELIGSGMTNLFGSFMGGFPMAGSFSRTAVLDSAGGKTQVAGIITGIVIILTYLFFTPLFTYLPNVTLASIILTSVINLIEAKEAQYLFRVRRLDFFAFMISLISTFVFGVEWGIAMAVGVSLVFVLWFSIKPNISVLGRVPNTVVYRDIDLYSGCIKTPGGILLKMDAPLFFVNANVLRKKIYQKEEEYKDINPVPLFYILLDCRGMTDIDSTGLGVLSEIAKKYIKQGVFFGLANVNDQVRKLMKVSNLEEIIRPNHIFSRVHDAVEAAIKWKTIWTQKEFFF
jgi:sulfate transporter 4